MSDRLPPHRDPRTVTLTAHAIRILHEQLPSLAVAVGLTDDGFEIARSAHGATADQRLASMASSLQALSEAIGRELGLGGHHYSLIESAGGRVLLRRIPGQPIALVAVLDVDATVDPAISLSRRVADDLAHSLAI